MNDKNQSPDQEQMRNKKRQKAENNTAERQKKQNCRKDGNGKSSK